MNDSGGAREQLLEDLAGLCQQAAAWEVAEAGRGHAEEVLRQVRDE